MCGASLTGLTALLLHDRDYLRLQTCLEKKLRALMLGTASWDGHHHIRILSSRKVWERWRLAPLACELCVQRLRWYQSIAREPARHAHLLHETLIDGQRLHLEANGYATRLLTDLQALAFVPEWAEQTTNVVEDLEDVFRSGSRNEWGELKLHFANCLMRMDGNVVNVGRRHERSLQTTSHSGGPHGSGKSGGHKPVLLVRFDTCQY